MLYKNRMNGTGRNKMHFSHSTRALQTDTSRKKAAANSSARTRVRKINTAYQPNEQAETLTDTNEDHYLP